MVTVLDKLDSLRGGVKFFDKQFKPIITPIKKVQVPQFVKIPLQHTNSDARHPIVSVGDFVLKGQRIADPAGNDDVPIHASTSGRIKAISKSILPTSIGESSDCVVIETDGHDRECEQHIQYDYKMLNPVKVGDKIRQAGIVGSTNTFLSDLSEDISTLIINVAETEPYISCEQAVLKNYSAEVISGIEILAYVLRVDCCVITIEEDKKEIVSLIETILSENENTNIRVQLIDSTYPASEEKQLIKAVTGKSVSFQTPSSNVGVMVENVSTAYAIKRAIVNTEPLTSRIVTVAGAGINQACNVEVLLGTPIQNVIEQCGGYNDQFGFLIVGGAMTGVQLFSEMSPVLSTTDALLALACDNSGDALRVEDCSSCDVCEPVCPIGLQVKKLYWSTLNSTTAQLEGLNLFDCIECGCCSYVCPSHIPLATRFKQAKSVIHEQQKKQEIAQVNKKRYLNKISRDKKQKEEREERRLKKLKQNKHIELENRQAAIAAAVVRVRKKRNDNK